MTLSVFDAYQGRENMENRGTGLFGSLAANRISYAFDFKGPSYIVDTACSTSFYVLVQAFQDMHQGRTENAIVATNDLNFHPFETYEYDKVGILCPDGICKAFNTNRNGYVRAEAVVSILLQRRKNSKRIYATIVGGRLNADGFKKEGPNHPAAEAQYELMKEVYTSYNIGVDDISYFEAHGTGTYFVHLFLEYT